ncbi:hypothetical protein [Bradyrhizobium erythrophlei]|uniref:Uncharacterized protein n=1 Tax=Bradyrhizobium erythrophlei TaxID=1437360 RepID=A0A1M5T7R1_9BRAD|nr:hypothetical protein [Bradyrhizobium erythrophlei]SHH46736.1 hypothetical protein SAMN05444169_7601 [Bradyrhizobium erythrophlei]
MFDYDVTGEEGNTRVTEIDNGNKITAARDLQYGFWTLSLDRGALPEKYKGSYTTHEAVDRAIANYLEDRNLAVADIDAPPRPVLQVKPGYEKK